MINALVIGATGGIGQALADALENKGANVVRLSRKHNGLDITIEAAVDDALAPLNMTFDLVIVATGILSAGDGPETDATEPRKD